MLRGIGAQATVLRRVESRLGSAPFFSAGGFNFEAATPGSILEKTGPGILTITPYYNRPTPDGLRRHFGAQAEAVEKMKSGFPMIMYNVPGRTGLNQDVTERGCFDRTGEHRAGARRRQWSRSAGSSAAVVATGSASSHRTVMR